MTHHYDVRHNIYTLGPDFAVVGNIVRTNGHNGCGGAENAGVKLHGFEGTFEQNAITQNTKTVLTTVCQLC